MEEYKFNLEYQFKDKPSVDYDNVDLTRKPRHTEGALPFVTITIKPLKLNEYEERVKVVNNLDERVYSRKASLDNKIKIEMGFTDDLKDHISVYRYDVIFYSKGKNISMIKLFVDEEGNFFINGEKHGKF